MTFKSTSSVTGEAASAHPSLVLLRDDPPAASADPAAHVLQVRDGGRQDHAEAAAALSLSGLFRLLHVRDGPQGEAAATHADADEASAALVVLHL